MNVTIITPERTVFDEEADGITIPAVTGELTILANHEPFVTLLHSGEVLLHHGKDRRHLAIHGGFVEVNNSRVRLLTDAAELEEEIDERRAAEALERARRASEAAEDNVVQAEALAAMDRALARLRVAERRKLRHRA